MKPQWRLIINSLWRQPVAPLERALPVLQRWFRSPMGREILAQEQALISERCAEFRGEVRLQSSSAGEALCGSMNPSALQIELLPSADSATRSESRYQRLVAELDHIPLPDESVDLLVVHHTLEFSSNPHRVLREAVRVLAPQGHLLVVAFNPYSLFGMRRWFASRFARRLPWAHHPLSIHRVSDWLSLMHCEPAGVGRGFYQLPFQSPRLLRWLRGPNRLLGSWGIPGGGFYILHACKYRYAGSRMKTEPALAQRLTPLSLVGGGASSIQREPTRRSRARLSVVEPERDPRD